MANSSDIAHNLLNEALSAHQAKLTDNDTEIDNVLKRWTFWYE